MGVKIKKLAMEDIQEQARFLYTTSNDVSINLIPAFSAYLLGVAALAVVSSQVLGGSDFLSSRSTTDKKSSDNQIVGQYPPPDVQQQPQYYQPAVAEQRQPYQPEYYQQQQQQYAQHFQPVGEKQDYVNSQEQVDIYQKLVNLQEELRKLQEAEKLLSNALSRRYSNVVNL